MFLSRIELRNFRNYARQTADFSPRVNIFFGQNAQGKTNLLEAMYLLSVGKSFRTAQDRDLIRQQAAGFGVLGLFEGSEFPLQPSTIEVAYDGCRKLLRLNGVSMRRQADIVGMARVVLFAPEDLQLVKGGPVFRRQYLDLGLAQTSRKYRDNLFRYTSVLAQRNRWLRDYSGKAGDLAALEAWTEQLVEYGSRVMQQRVEGIRMLDPIARHYHEQLSGSRESLSVGYVAGTSAPSGSPDEHVSCEDYLRSALDSHQHAELIRGTTLAGPHRDDLLLSLDGQGELRLYGSQGQARTATLALKMAMVEYMRRQTGDYPLLLLDDVLSEFDDDRKTALLDTVVGVTQTFITTTTPRYFSPGPDTRMFRVSEGVVEPWLDS